MSGGLRADGRLSGGKMIKYAFSGIAETETGCKAQVVVSDETMVYAKLSLLFDYEPM